MIARTLRTAAEWLRNRRHRRRKLGAMAAATRADRTARRLDLLRQAARHRVEARRLFAEAQAVKCFAERHSLYCQRLATECRADACYAQAGGDAVSAAAHTVDAEDYERRAGLPVPVDAAHAPA